LRDTYDLVALAWRDGARRTFFKMGVKISTYGLNRVSAGFSTISGGVFPLASFTRRKGDPFKAA